MSMPKLPTMALPRSHDPELRRSLLGSHNGGSYGATGITNPIADPTNGGGNDDDPFNMMAACKNPNGQGTPYQKI